jgi:hypothetical protein
VGSELTDAEVEWPSVSGLEIMLEEVSGNVPSLGLRIRETWRKVEA